LFQRLNKTFINKKFEFRNDLVCSVKWFLGRFDSIFSLNQDLLLEIHYMQGFSLRQVEQRGSTRGSMGASYRTYRVVRLNHVQVGAESGYRGQSRLSAVLQTPRIK
jgi:hypothetical protein